MGNWYTATVLVFLMVLTPWASMTEGAPPNNSESLDNSPISSVQVQESLPLWTPGSAVIDHDLPRSGSELVSVIVLTDRLTTLHEWQIDNGVLPKQIENEAQFLVPAPPTQGILEHRLMTISGFQIAKLPGVPGVRAVISDFDIPRPAGYTMTAEPASVRSGEIHGATDVWDDGRNGTGIIVAVADSGVDFAHPDLNGTQARYNNATSPYHGWPLMHDPVSILDWLRDGEAYPDSDGSWWADTSETDADSDNDSELDNSSLSIAGIPPSVSGTYHIGLHPDSKLVSRAGGDVPVIVVDEVTSGVYDTVYVDLDRDSSFSDEVPMRRGSETAGLDLNGDGLWDRSAGMIWWISDGINGVPYGDVYAARNGYQNRIADSGDLVLFMINDVNEGGGNHGTLCASAINAQGVVNSGSVLGMAPGSKTTAVANLYSYGSWFDSYRFIAEGYDGNASTEEQPHIGSFSFGYSGTHDDGADANSLYLDWLTRVHSPNTTYLVATGNGGHGYGTTAAPGGAHGVISVSAFSSKSGESNGGTWGQSASWSNRGPNSVSRLDPDVVAVGWSATGDRTLNEVTNANSATTTWGGTSLATPIAAGLAALIYESWIEVHGSPPNSQQVRDIMMSTADDRGYDPFVQGAGWVNVSRAVDTILGVNGSMSVRPAAWMTGEMDGLHRDANLNMILPGGNQSVQIELENSGLVPVEINLQPEVIAPLHHDIMRWNSTDTGPNATWDGYQSGTPDILIPLHIANDSNISLPNGTTLLRARAAMDGAGFDGNKNYESENRIYLRLWRWTDRDGDGIFHNDIDGDRFVDASEWTEDSNEFAMLTEHVYASGQVEVRMGKPLAESDDGLLLAVWRENIRTNEIDPLPVEIDWTAFGPTSDVWVSTVNNITIPANTTTTTNVTISVPPDADPGVRQHGLRMDYNTVGDPENVTSWLWPIITNVAYQGSFSVDPRPLDGNMSNQSLFEETWLQGAQRWGWRAESGDWKTFSIDWPVGYTVNGTALIDVDWPDNEFTDVDVFWMSEEDHPYSFTNPLDYGPHNLQIESNSRGMHRGSGIYGHETSTDESHEFLTASSSPGVKQVLLHSATHGVGTNDNPLSIDVGMLAPMDGGLGVEVYDWRTSNRSETIRIGSTMDVDITDATGVGWSQPQHLSGQSVGQDTPGDKTSASYIHSFSIQDIAEITISTSSTTIPDLDLYIGQDINGNGVMDFGNEEKGSSGNWNSDESVSLDNPGDGLWFVAVHGFDVGNGSGTFSLDIDMVPEATNTGLQVSNITEMNQSQITANWPNGSLEIAGETPVAAWELNLSLIRPWDSGHWTGYIDLELAGGAEIRLVYTYDLIQSPPSVEFHVPTPVNGTRTNSTIPLALHLLDLDSGLNLTGLDWNFSHTNQLATNGLSWGDGIWFYNVECEFANGTIVDRSTHFFTMVNGTGNESNMSRNVLLNETYRSVWINGTVPENEGWYAYEVVLLDVTNRLDQASFHVEYDVTAPLLALNNWRTITNHSTVDDVVILTEPGSIVWVNGTLHHPDENGEIPLILDLSPSNWTMTENGLDWIQQNRFEIAVIDAAGNWNRLKHQMVYDPHPPGSEGEARDAITLEGVIPIEPNGIQLVDTSQMQLGVNASIVDVVIEVPNDTASVCLTLTHPNGSDLDEMCNLSFSQAWPTTNGTAWLPEPVESQISHRSNVVMRVDFSDEIDGIYGVRFDVIDFAGHHGFEESFIDVDRLSPVIEWVGFEPVWDRTSMVISASFGEWTDHRLTMNGEYVTQSAGSSLSESIQFGRTGNHTFCISAYDRTVVTEHPNLALSCRTVLLDPAEFEPQVIADWNGTTVPSSSVTFDVLRGWGQNAVWTHLESMTDWATIPHPGKGISESTTVSLVEGPNRLLVDVEAVDSIVRFELEVILDTTAPRLTSDILGNELLVNNPVVIMTGGCESGLLVRIDASGIERIGDCDEFGRYTIELTLDNFDGSYPVVIRSVDTSGNIARLDRMIELDLTAPEALLGWEIDECNPREPTRVVGDTPGTICNLVGAAALVDDDVDYWTVEFMHEGVYKESFTGIGTWNGSQEFPLSEPVEGRWSMVLILVDEAGNERSHSIDTEIQGREATTSEGMFTVGTLSNSILVGVLLISITGMTVILARNRPSVEKLGSEWVNQEFDDESDSASSSTED